MAPTGADRRSTQEFHPNRRDASDPRASGSWSSEPTAISIPSNERRSAHPGGPYSNRLKSNLGTGLSQTHPTYQKSSNPNRNRTVASVIHPAKRRKVESPANPVTSRYWDNSTTTSRPLPASDASTIGFIDLSADPDEDIGVPLSRDDLSARQRSSSDPMALTPGQHIDGGPSYNSEQVPRLAPDGVSTEKLRQRIEGGQVPKPIVVHSDEDSESIESASAFDMPDPPAPNGWVKTQIAECERRGGERPVPHLDLRKIGTRSRMKAKFQDPPSADPLMDSTLRPPAPKQKVQRRVLNNAKLGQLPIAIWYKGTQCFDDGRYLLELVNNKTTPRLVLKQDKRVIFDILANREIAGVQVSTPSNNHFIIILQTTKFERNNMATQCFTPGSTGFDGTIAFQIDTTDSTWNDGVWNGVCQYFKDATKGGSTVEHLDSHASRSSWGVIVDNSHHTVHPIEPIPNEARIKSQQLDVGSDGESTGMPESWSKSVPTTKGVGSLAQPVASSSRWQSLRRSSRQSVHTMPVAQESPPEDTDELILVYPPTGTGAVNITKGDVNRLQPGQYLNDTLIEFGLKLWLSDLRDENPQLAEQIHVFSSFFYKKFDAKDKEEGYKSVRKWTQKFDIFKKKYIIFPINENLHWYLAIVYQPEHMLSPPPPEIPHQKPLTRKRKRESDISLFTKDVATGMSLPYDQPISRQEDDLWNPEHATMEGIPTFPSSTQRADASEHEEAEKKEVEDIVNGVERSCSISDPSEFQQARSGNNEKSKELEPMDLVASPPSTSYPMDVDPENILEPGASTAGRNAGDTIDLGDGDETPGAASVAPTRFYGASSKSKGKQKAAPMPFQLSVDPDSEKEEAEPEPDIPIEDGHRYTWIFTFDSLNGTHPKAIKNLQAYLQFEAADKKSLTEVTATRGKKAMVPIQTNYCDCGVYLVHFVRTFMKDPEGSVQKILTRKGKLTTKERADDWDGDLVKSYRQDLLQRIYELQEVWKKEKLTNEDSKGKEAEKQDAVTVESSDDDIIIEEPPVTETSVQSKGRKRKTIKKPITSAAERFRSKS